MDREIILDKSLFETRKFILNCNSRYTSKIVGRSTRVKSVEHGKIFKTTSVTNLSAFSNKFFKVKSTHMYGEGGRGALPIRARAQ